MMRNHMRPPISIVGLILLGIPFACLSCIHDCETTGKEWCDGEVHKRCSKPDRGHLQGNWIAETDCADLGATCKEVGWSDGEMQVGCVLSETPCPGGMLSLCLGNRPADCSRMGFPEAATSCKADQVCVEDFSVREAFCAYSRESCLEGAMRCVSGESGAYLECKNGVWQVKVNCPAGRKCVDIVPDAGTMPPDAGLDAGQDGGKDAGAVPGQVECR